MKKKDVWKLATNIRVKDLVYMFKLAVSYIPGKVYKSFNKDVWIISESPENARDNGYWLFKYVREHYPEKKVFYPIKSNCFDFSKIEALGNYIKPGSWRHYILFWAASKYIGTTKYHGFPDERICAGIFEMGMSGFKYVFLNHGFTRGHSNIVDGNKTSYSLIFAMSEIEKKIIVELNYQEEKKVKAIGFCRHDNLDNSIVDPKLIVVMPTWRRWLDYRHAESKERIEKLKKDFLVSSYYESYTNLINNEDLLKFLEDKNLKLVLYFHGYAQEYLSYFKSASDRIIIAKKEEYFIQDLLKQAAFLITDYSSVAIDYGYMKKAMLYYQFDAEEFAEKQYSNSKYYNFEEDGFGPIVNRLEDVVDTLKKSYQHGFIMEQQYVDRVNRFFPSFDTKHCERTYEIISGLK